MMIKKLLFLSLIVAFIGTTSVGSQSDPAFGDAPEATSPPPFVLDPSADAVPPGAQRAASGIDGVSLDSPAFPVAPPAETTPVPTDLNANNPVRPPIPPAPRTPARGNANPATTPRPAAGGANSENPVYAPLIDGDTIAAGNEFGWGVRAFHEGFHNKAIVSFEKAISLKPRDPLYRMWLGFANYYAGFNDAAVSQWDSAAGAIADGSWLKAKVDAIRFRRSPYADSLSEDKWAERGTAEGVNSRNMLFLRPSSVATDPIRGGSFVAGYAGDTVAYFDVNGDAKNRYSGGLVEFDGPFDVAPLDDGRFFVSEFRANRISLSSKRGLRVGVIGTGEGKAKLSGPQFLATDKEGYLYVSDWGNKRVVKFDFNGKFIMEIGLPDESFAGLAAPTGLTVGPAYVYVSDREKRTVEVFDKSGNHVESLGEGRLSAPEGLTLHQNRYLFVADGKDVKMCDLQDRSFIKVTDLYGKARRIMKVAVDRNGSLLVADNDSNKIHYLTRLSNLYGGFFVDIKRVVADKFPKVSVEVAVQDRSGAPIIGMGPNNFLIGDGGGGATQYAIGSDDAEIQGDLDAALVVESSQAAALMNEALRRGVSDMYNAVTGKGRLGLFLSGTAPSNENAFTREDALTNFDRHYDDSVSFDWKFDMAVRLAASTLIPKRGKQTLFFLTSGMADDAAFSRYEPSELAVYLKNNGIAFYPIYLSPDAHNDTYDYIAKETGGESSYLFRPRGPAGLIEEARAKASGTYIITYTSKADGSFGARYIPLRVEVFLQKQSGRTESGYFSPIS